MLRMAQLATRFELPRTFSPPPRLPPRRIPPALPSRPSSRTSSFTAPSSPQHYTARTTPTSDIPTPLPPAQLQPVNSATVAHVLESAGIIAKAKRALERKKRVWQLSFDSNSSEEEGMETAARANQRYIFLKKYMGEEITWRWLA